MAFFQTDTLWVNEAADGVAVLVLDVPETRNNPLGRRVLTQLHAALDQIEAQSRFRLLVLCSGKAQHFASSVSVTDLAEMHRAEDFLTLASAGQQFCARLEALRMPTIAVIAGNCRGAGLELALACDYRVVMAKPAAALAFGDLEMGLSPTWGGTQRLPRIVGIERSLNMILGNRTLGPHDAVRWGLADVVSELPQEQSADLIESPEKRPASKLPYRTIRQRLLESNRLGRWLLFRGAEAWVRRRMPRDMPAPGEILQILRTGVEMGLEAGLARERDASARLGETHAFRQLLALQLLREKQRQAWRGNVDEATWRRVGVLGAGQRGAALMHLLVSHGLEVTVREPNETVLGMAMFRLLTLFQQEVQHGAVHMNKVKKQLEGIHATTTWKGFDEVDVVFDATATTPDARGEFYRDLTENIPDAALIVSTSKSSTVAEIQHELEHPQRCAGFHPLPRSPVIEIVRGEQTDEATIDKLAAGVVALGRTPVILADRPGMLVHRVLLASVLEAVQLVKEGVAPKLIDETMRRFGLSWGPLEWADLLGLDTASEIINALEPVWGERFPRDEVFAHILSRQWFGQRTNRGFYRYKRGKQLKNVFLMDYLHERGREEGVYPGPTTSQRDQRKLVEQRIVGITVNEACTCLQEGVIANESLLDLAMALAGWAPHRGGPIAHARHLGVDVFVESLLKLAQDHGPRFLPASHWSTML